MMGRTVWCGRAVRWGPRRVGAPRRCWFLTGCCTHAPGGVWCHMTMRNGICHKPNGLHWACAGLSDKMVLLWEKNKGVRGRDGCASKQPKSAKQHCQAAAQSQACGDTFLGAGLPSSGSCVDLSKHSMRSFKGRGGGGHIVQSVMRICSGCFRLSCAKTSRA